MKNSKSNNKQKIYLLKGGSGSWFSLSSWNDWLKLNKFTQGPYESSRIEGMVSWTGNFFGNFFLGWSKYFTILYIKYSPYKFIFEMVVSITSSVTTTIINAINNNKDMVKKLLDYFKTSSIKELPKIGGKS